MLSSQDLRSILVYKVLMTRNNSHVSITMIWQYWLGRITSNVHSKQSKILPTSFYGIVFKPGARPRLAEDRLWVRTRFTEIIFVQVCTYM